MWREKREGEENQPPKFPFSIKKKSSLKNWDCQVKYVTFLIFCVRMIRTPFVGINQVEVHPPHPSLYLYHILYNDYNDL